MASRPHGVFLLQQKAKRPTECLLQGSHVFVELPPTMTGWWFQIFFIFTPKIGEDDPILTIFQRGWFNHQLAWVSWRFGKALKKKNGVISPYRLKVSGPMPNRTGWEGWRCELVWRYHDAVHGRNQALCAKGNNPMVTGLTWTYDHHGD